MNEPTFNLKAKTKALRAQVRHSAPEEIERMLNATRATGITTTLIETCLRSNKILVVHSESWKQKLQDEHPKLLVKLAREVKGGDPVLIDNGLNLVMLRELRSLQAMCEDLLNYIEVKKLEDKP